MTPEDATAWSLARLNQAFFHHYDRRTYDALLVGQHPVDAGHGRMLALVLAGGDDRFAGDVSPTYSRSASAIPAKTANRAAPCPDGL
ncbi:hypothetical protein [Nonomuraea turkmeniaca]|nr:hypothetical protein [Nonomuraea turkmeniaca]